MAGVLPTCAEVRSIEPPESTDKAFAAKADEHGTTIAEPGMANTSYDCSSSRFYAL